MTTSASVVASVTTCCCVVGRVRIFLADIGVVATSSAVLSTPGLLLSLLWVEKSDFLPLLTTLPRLPWLCSVVVTSTVSSTLAGLSFTGGGVLVTVFDCLLLNMLLLLGLEKGEDLLGDSSFFL